LKISTYEIIQGELTDINEENHERVISIAQMTQFQSTNVFSNYIDRMDKLEYEILDTIFDTYEYIQFSQILSINFLKDQEDPSKDVLNMAVGFIHTTKVTYKRLGTALRVLE